MSFGLFYGYRGSIPRTFTFSAKKDSVLAKGGRVVSLLLINVSLYFVIILYSCHYCCARHKAVHGFYPSLRVMDRKIW